MRKPTHGIYADGCPCATPAINDGLLKSAMNSRRLMINTEMVSLPPTHRSPSALRPSCVLELPRDTDANEPNVSSDSDEQIRSKVRSDSLRPGRFLLLLESIRAGCPSVPEKAGAIALGLDDRTTLSGSHPD